MAGRPDEAPTAVDTCQLCREIKPLLESHIIPSFVFKSLKNKSATGHIRHSENVNQRVQDGTKERLLCSACETRFSAWEREFANKVYQPWQGGATHTPYDKWLLKFCVSLSWRILKYCRGKNPSADYSVDQLALMDEAELIWRAFLLGQRPHPGNFSQQLVIFDIIDSTSVTDLPENINRFLMNAIAMDIVGSTRTLMTWAKMGQFQIFGVVQPGPDKFEGTKVHVGGGVLQPGNFILPAGILALFREKADHINESMKNMSDAQYSKVETALMRNIDRFAQSKQFFATQADAEMFGVSAVLRKSPGCN